MLIVKILILHFTNSKKRTKYQLIEPKIFGQTTIEYLLSNEYKIIGVNN